MLKEKLVTYYFKIQDKLKSFFDKRKTSSLKIFAHKIDSLINALLKKGFDIKKNRNCIVATAIVLTIGIAIMLSSSIKVAVYMDGEKIGYVSDANQAMELAEKYNENGEIILQSEFTLSNEMLTIGKMESIIEETQKTELTKVHVLHIDEVQMLYATNADDIKLALLQLQNDLSELLNYNVSIYNNIEISEAFCSEEMITSGDKIYQSLCGTATITPEHIKISTTLSEDGTPIRLYSINGILFETFEYITQNHTIEAQVQYINDNTMYVGSQKLITEGSNGIKTEMYKSSLCNGEVQYTELLDVTTSVKVQNTIIAVGTKPIKWSENPKVLLFPLATEHFKYSSEFGMRKHPIYGDWRLHSGIDIGCSTGTNVLAADSGVVTISKDQKEDTGIYIEILHDNGLITRYLHLSQRLVEEGERVYAGQVIALSGNTGTSTGPHLHFTVKDVNGELVDPRLYTQFP